MLKDPGLYGVGVDDREEPVLVQNAPILLTLLQCYSKNASLSLKRGWAVPAKAALDLCKTEDAEGHDTIEIVQGRSERSCEESRRKTTCKLFLFHCCFVCADVFDSIALLRPLATQDWRCRAQPLRKD